MGPKAPGNTADVFPIKFAQATPSEMSILGKWIEKPPGIIGFDYSQLISSLLFRRLLFHSLPRRSPISPEPEIPWHELPQATEPDSFPQPRIHRIAKANRNRQ